jgi:hypothetical protein
VGAVARRRYRIVQPASSLAIVLARPTTPCLAATYGAKNGRPLIPAVELMLMIDPPSLRIRCGTAAIIVGQMPWCSLSFPGNYAGRRSAW